MEPKGIGAIKLTPMRSFKDFLFSSRPGFDIPMKEEWARRVKTNLLYYQSNYGIIIAAIMIYVWLRHPFQLNIGLLLTALGITGYIHFPEWRQELAGTKVPTICGIGGLFLGYYTFWPVLQSLLVLTVATTAFTLMILAHASVRIAKTDSQVDSKTYKNTPMQIIIVFCSVIAVVVLAIIVKIKTQL